MAAIAEWEEYCATRRALAKCIQWCVVTLPRKINREGENQVVFKRKKIAIKVLVFLAALVCGVAVYLYSVRSRPAVYRYFEKGDPVEEPAFVIFNPFRNRSAERQADSFLQLLKEGHCDQALSALPIKQETRHELCDLEVKSPLEGWRLTNRTDQTNDVRMYYWVKRKSYKGYIGQLWVNVEKRGEGWQVTKYECFY